MILAKKDDFTKMTQFPTCVASIIVLNSFYLTAERRRQGKEPLKMIDLPSSNLKE